MRLWLSLQFLLSSSSTFSAPVEESDVIASNQRVIISVLHQLIDLVRAFARDAASFVSGIIHNSTRELALLLVQYAHGVPAFELAPDFEYARREKARLSLQQRLTSPFVDHQGGHYRGGEGDPSAFAWESSGRGEEGSKLLTRENAIDDIGRLAAGDDNSASRLRGNASGFEFGLHSSATETRCFSVRCQLF